MNLLNKNISINYSEINAFLSGLSIAIVNSNDYILKFASKSFCKMFSIVDDFNCSDLISVEKLFYKEVNLQLLSQYIDKVVATKDVLFITQNIFNERTMSEQNFDTYILPVIIDGDVNCCAIQLLPKGHKLVENDDLIAFLAHEIMNPLNNINCAIQLIEKIYSDELSDNVRKYLNQIKQNTMIQTRMLTHLLCISKSETGHFENKLQKINLIHITSDLVNSIKCFAEKKGVEVVYYKECDGFCAYIDADNYQHIFLNLVSNAIKFTPSGKKIYISIKCNDDSFYLKVRDEGKGIDNDDISTIFDKYKQVATNENHNIGFGLGLTLVKQLTERMCGKISVSSKLGIGTEFNVSLPVQKDYMNDDISSFSSSLNMQKSNVPSQMTDNRIQFNVNLEMAGLY